MSFKLRKQYSVKWQVVELEVQGEIDEYDQLADWLDSTMETEVNAIPQSIFDKNKDKQSFNKPTQTKTKEQYTKNKKTYKANAGSKDANYYYNMYKEQNDGKQVGTQKQWQYIVKNREKLEQAGYDLDNLDVNYSVVKEMLDVVFDK